MNRRNIQHHYLIQEQERYKHARHSFSAFGSSVPTPIKNAHSNELGIIYDMKKLTSF